jgi:type II secretory pathway pseudopilin PulG
MTARRPAGRRTDDAGFSLIDMVVAMSVLSIVLAIFTGAVVRMFNAAAATEARADASAQITIAVMRLDKEIRYADGISQPGSAAGDPYVEYLTTGTGSPVCVELRVHGGQLQRRSWAQGGSIPRNTWLPLATGVTATTPFTRYPAGSTYTFQRLKLSVTATGGGGRTTAAKTTDVTFTALNTSLATTSDSTCTEGRSVP